MPVLILIIIIFVYVTHSQFNPNRTHFAEFHLLSVQSLIKTECILTPQQKYKHKKERFYINSDKQLVFIQRKIIEISYLNFFRFYKKKKTLLSFVPVFDFVNFSSLPASQIIEQINPKTKTVPLNNRNCRKQNLNRTQNRNCRFDRSKPIRPNPVKTEML